MKSLAILGSTGSIGRNTLEIIDQFPDRFCVKALTAWSNVDLLADQISRYSPEIAAVGDHDRACSIKNRLPGDSKTRIVHGVEGCLEAAAHPEAQMVVAAMVGAAGLMPTLTAIESGKDIALANKETLVMAGRIVMETARVKQIRLLPVDSEHSAIFQCLGGLSHPDLDRIILTASGGPFRSMPREAFEGLTPERALKHPTWQMGPKISIDSATLMNKGLEVIEAMHLFGLDVNSIDVVVHPESIVHSMVAFTDGSVLAQMGIPDMKGAIAYALTHPERLSLRQPIPNLPGIGSLTFEVPDLGRFPCLSLAFEAGRIGGTLPTVMNAANEVAVQGFLSGIIGFTDIQRIIEETMERHTAEEADSLDLIRGVDQWGREIAAERIRAMQP
jgi:1-deoxy-D-xylulose-5-phosphate reductoisomerase